MEEIKEKIIRLGDQNNIKGLQEYIADIDTTELTSVLDNTIRHQSGVKIWRYLLLGFDDSSPSQEKRFKICMFVLKLMEENEISTKILTDIILSLKIELPKFKCNHLIDICNLCIKQIQEGNLLHTSWADLFPEVLNILVEKNCVMFNNVQMSGTEFRNQIINTLCSINWSANIVTPLASMFSDISLTKEEHLQVVIKLSQCLENLTCQEVPAFTFQLLKLCAKQNSRIIFLKLQHYFSHRIYKNLGQDLEPSTDSTDLDEIISSNEHDAVQVESTILYHIVESARYGNDCIKEYLNSMKTLTKAPEYILHPFQLTVLLTISSVHIFEEQSLDIIRSCIVRIITEDVKKSDTAWFRNILSTSSKTSNIISVVLENSIKERPFLGQGLVNLSFVLLNAGAALGMKNIAEAQWQLGTFTLLKLMKKNDLISTTIIKTLCNKIVIGEDVPHLTECLNQMCRNLILTMIENQGIIIQLTDETLLSPAWSSKYIIDALLPLIKVSNRLRDNLILLLRKSLYSRELEIKKMAVGGYLKLLKCLKLSNLATLSQQGSSSNCSFLSQISLESHIQRPTQQFSSEAICLEILGILRRCFMQQAEVRQELYDGLYSSLSMNLELGIPALKMLSIHLDQFYAHEENELPPLDFSKIYVKKGVEVILQEPLGHLIYVIGLILNKLKENHDHSEPTILRMTKIMDSLCSRMAKCELVHFNLDTGRDLLDDLPECQSDSHTLKQAMSVYEALMGYLVISWKPDSENVGQKIYALFQAYSRLVDLSKSIGKPKKADGGRKKNKDDTTKNKTVTGKSKTFKPVLTVFDFQTAGKILSILYEPTLSQTVTESNILKIKCEFHRYILNVIYQLVHNVKASKCIETIHTKPYFNYCTEIATVLNEKIIQRLAYVVDFDINTAVLGVECFHLILNLIITYYKEKFITFLSTLGHTNKDKELGDYLLPFIEIFHNFFEKDDDEYTDSEGKKLPPLMVNIYTILINNLPHHATQTTQVLGWLKKFTNDNTVHNKVVGSALITVCINLNIRCKEESGLYENVASKLCDVIGTIANDKPECPVPLKIINESTALPALSSLTSALKTMLNEAEWIIQRCRAEYTLIINPGADRIERRKEILKSRERNLCCHFCRIVNVCTLISNMAVPPGSNVETVFKLIMQLYNTLNSLTKYFLLTSSKINPAFQNARFERVLKLSGKPLSNMVYSFILYIEQGPDPEDETSQQRKKSANPNAMKSKILRETRLIPKLVYEMEQFGRNVITLSNKTKIELSKYVGLGTFRDFRIKAPALKEALEGIEENEDGDTTASSIPLETEDTTHMDVEEEEQDQEEDGSPPEKKTRK